MPSAGPLRDGSASVGPLDTSPLLARSPDLARRSSGSVDPATPADPPVADLPTALDGTPPTVFVPLPATASSSSGHLRSVPLLATDSSSACALAPGGAGATAVAADPDSPSSAPRSPESHPSALTSEYAGHPGDPSSACVPASGRSRWRRQSTTPGSVPPAVARTSVLARSLPFPPVLSFPAPPGHGKTSPLPRGAPVAALAVPRSRYLQKQFAESSGGNRIL